MDTIEAIHSRRSIRVYVPKPVERDLIEDVIYDAAQAPPPFSGQIPWTFNVIQGIDRIAELGQRAMEYARAHDTGDARLSAINRPGFDIFWSAPVLVVISGEPSDCCRAGQNLMLSAHARGLGTCWVGSPMPWLRTDVAKSELQIPAGQTPVVAMCLGYPHSTPASPPRVDPPIIWVP